MFRSLGRAVLVVSALAGLACGKAPAEAALKAADQAIESVKPQVEKLVPDQLSALTSAAQDARAKFEKGDYKAAMEAAQALVPRAQEALAAAMAKKDELTKSFGDLQGSLSGIVSGLTQRVAELSAPRAKLPAGMDKVSFETAKNRVGELSQRWTDVAAAFQGGDIAAAVEKGKALKSEAEALAAQLGASMAGAPTAPAAK